MEIEKKVETEQQAPAQAPAGQKTEPVAGGAPAPTGMDNLTVEQLKSVYAKSPQLFAEAGIVVPKEAAPASTETVKPQTPPVNDKATDELGVAWPKDVPVNVEAASKYLKDLGVSKEQAQKLVDFEADRYRAATKAEATADAANVAALKADKEFGAKYDENMEIARKAVLKHGSPELTERLKHSDPVLVKFLWKVGQADGEDRTSRAPGGGASEDAAEAEAKHFRDRYPNSPSMFGEGG